MLSGSITKGLLTISIPVVQSMFNILDMTILKSFDTDGMTVGAVGACGSLITLINGLVIGISAGANVIIAGYIGSRNQICANRAVGTAVAIATITGWAVTAILNVITLMRNAGYIQLSLRNVRFYRPELPRILRIGIPVGLQQGLYSFANVAITAAVNNFGPAATTGISIANNFDGILYQICKATSLAVMPYVSQTIGAHNLKRAMQSVWKGIMITVALGASFGALSAIFSGQLSSLMTSDPEVIAFSKQKMIIIASTYYICGINDVFCAAPRGMGKSIAPTVATLVFLFGLRFT